MSEKTFDHTEIYNEAKHYDLINDFEEDIPLWLKYAQKANGKTLELGCGTGRVTIPLAQESIDIVGVDVSGAMLELAEEKAAKRGVNLDLRKENIIDFDLGEKFDFIFSIHNSFSHIDGVENVKKFFNSVKRHLNKNGVFVLQVFNPDFYFFTRDPNEKFPLKKYKDPDSDKMVELSENNFYDDESQINYFKWYFKIGDKEIVKNWNQRVYYPQELDYLVQLNEFEIIEKFGDVDETPFTENPETQILVCKLKEPNI